MTIRDVGVKCSRCGVKFNSKQIPVFFDTGVRNSELRHVPGPDNIRLEHYSICTCPGCGHADWANTFEVLREKISIQQQHSPTHLQYRIAATEAEREGRAWYKVGMLYLYAAWCADDESATLQGQEYRRLAIECFRRSLKDNSCPYAERVTIEYLIGELLRRSSDCNESIQHFKEVIPRLSSKYAFMARKLLRLAEVQQSDAIHFDIVSV